MTNYEMVVSAICLVAGYWGVTKSLKHADSIAASDKQSAASYPQIDAPWHEVLEVSPDATDEEISAAYKRRISDCHSDKVGTLGKEIQELAERKSKAINAAYETARRMRRG
ncbi:MAG TPA: J domain-containing protein [Steroidobacteraceae bacterium]|jgi:DnaJ like chaperone protein